MFLSRFAPKIAIATTGDTFFIKSERESEKLIEIPAFYAKSNGKVLAIGQEAKDMYKMSPSSIEVCKIINEGIVTDIIGATEVISYGLKKLKKSILRPRILSNLRLSSVGAPLKQAIEESGASEVYLMSHGMACAMGLDLPVTEPIVSGVLSLEHDWFEFSTISLAGYLKSVSKAYGIEAIIGDACWYYKTRSKQTISIPKMGEKLLKLSNVRLGFCT